MRTAFYEEMDELTTQLADMCEFVSDAMERANQALLQADLALAEQVIEEADSLSEKVERNEELAFALLALQAPVAGDLRRVVSSIQIVYDIRRMGVLAHHIAKVARRRHPANALPEAIRGYFAEMGRIAISLGRSAQEILVTRDAVRAAELAAEDDAMDDLHTHLLTLLTVRDWPHGIEAAVDVTLLGRYYERFADHAVQVAQRVIFLATGKLPDDAFAIDSSEPEDEFAREMRHHPGSDED